jgi:xanthine dehydrogenase accessory factor
MFSSKQVFQLAAQFEREGRPFALITVVRCEAPTSAKPGAKGIVDAAGEIHGWIGGGCAQPAVIKSARQALADGQPRLVRISPGMSDDAVEGIVEFGMPCHSGGTLDIFVDPVNVVPSLLVIGTSAAGCAVAAFAASSGFAATIAGSGVAVGRVSDAVVIVDSFERARGIEAQFVVVATQGKRDEEGIELALSTKAQFIGLIASERKAEKLKDALRQRGQSAENLARITAPVGVPIQAQTPEEIGVSVVAEIIRVRRSLARAVEATVPAAASPAAMQSASAPEVEERAVAADPVCGMNVTAADAPRVEYRGAEYRFCCSGCAELFSKHPERYVGARHAV